MQLPPNHLWNKYFDTDEDTDLDELNLNGIETILTDIEQERLSARSRGRLLKRFKGQRSTQNITFDWQISAFRRMQEVQHDERYESFAHLVREATNRLLGEMSINIEDESFKRVLISMNTAQRAEAVSDLVINQDEILTHWDDLYDLHKRDRKAIVDLLKEMRNFKPETPRLEKKFQKLLRKFEDGDDD